LMRAAMKTDYKRRKTHIRAALCLSAMLALLIVIDFVQSVSSAGDRSNPDISRDKSEEMVPSTPIVGRTSIETYPVSIKTKGHALSIPRNYIETAAFFSTSMFFRVAMTFPDFQGVKQASAEMFRSLTAVGGWWGTAPPNVIWADDAVSLSTAKRQSDDPVIAAARKQDNASPEFGLTKVSGLAVLGDYYVFPGPPPDAAVVIKCSRVIKETCQSEFDLAPGLVVEYGYDRALLSNWREIDRGVKQLLMSFVER
jgi:hypothetical protein